MKKAKNSLWKNVQKTSYWRQFDKKEKKKKNRHHLKTRMMIEKYLSVNMKKQNIFEAGIKYERWMLRVTRDEKLMRKFKIDWILHFSADGKSTCQDIVTVFFWVANIIMWLLLSQKLKPRLTWLALALLYKNFEQSSCKLSQN